MAAEYIYCSYHASFPVLQIIAKESQPFMDGKCVKEL
jgi:hypothetical protein